MVLNNEPPTNPSESNKPEKKNVSFFTYIVSAILFLVVGFIIGSRSDQFALNFGSRNPQNIDLSSVQQTYAELKAKFDGTLDTEKLIEGANRGLVNAAGDQYTTFFNAEEAREFNEDLDGTFSGIGAELDKKDGKLIIVSPLDDSPAQRAGLKPNDVVAKVNNQSTTDWSIDEAVAKIKGKKGTTVKLTVLRGDEVKEIVITRDTITNPSVKTEKRDDIGIVRISRFGDDTASRVRKAADEFRTQDVKGVVVDLRGNGGGYLEAANEIASLWLDKGTVILTERRGGKVIETHRASGDPVFKGMPTIVLIDNASASASEILAGSLQDNKAAKLVGEKSFGKGSVQSIVNLRGGAELKVTVARWYTPKGKNISEHGISPDEIVAFGENSTRENDPQLNKALELLK